jgi:uncharacterized protein DUF6869
VTPTPELVVAYWRHYELTQGGRDDRLAADASVWAFEEVHDLVSKGDPLEALDLIIALVDTAPGIRAVCYVGAGPLENLIAIHPEVTVEAIDAQARRHEPFQIALNSVYFSDRIPRPVIERLGRFRL